MTADESVQLAARKRKADFMVGVLVGSFVCVLLACVATLAVWGTYRVIAGAPDRDAVCIESSRYLGCTKWEKL